LWYSVEMMRIGVKTGQWGWSFDELERSWSAAEEAGFELLGCFDHVSASPRQVAAWDAPTTLAAMAARTTRIAIAVRVLNVCLRHPFLLAAQLAVAQATSHGRLDVGLGAGSFWLARSDHETLGIVFPSLEDRIERLDAVCRTLPAIWRGERVTDELLGLSDANLGPIDIDLPRLVAGGTSASVMAIAARHCDGWNISTPDPIGFRRLAYAWKTRVHGWAGTRSLRRPNCGPGTCGRIPGPISARSKTRGRNSSSSSWTRNVVPTRFVGLPTSSFEHRLQVNGGSAGPLRSRMASS
jgi:alkanesulfonate monooxygenase SsuD/methylene tetrahydromethanopterin reductase-like flavin-dependent oxidoreductase (luciferase family)